MLAARIVAAVIALGACLALPVIAGAESPQATPPARSSFASRSAACRRLHLHGYDIETRVEPGKPAVTAFTARLTGRLPVAIHSEGVKHRHSALLHVEIYPR